MLREWPHQLEHFHMTEDHPGQNGLSNVSKKRKKELGEEGKEEREEVRQEMWEEVIVLKTGGRGAWQSCLQRKQGR